jgi:hypothetical protein
MATLTKKPLPGPWDEKNPTDWDARMKAEGNVLDALQAKSDALPEGEIVGALIQFSVADGSAVYVVTKAKPLTVAHVPAFDGYRVHEAMIRGLRVADVLHQLKWRKSWAVAKRTNPKA